MFHVKIIDWGLAVKYEDQSGTARNYAQCGTIDYHAPEVFLGRYNEKRDVWSVGCIMYTILGNQPPFSVQSVPKTIENIRIGKYNLNLPQFKLVSPEAIDLIRKMLTYRPNDRPTAQEALEHPWFEKIR